MAKSQHRKAAHSEKLRKKGAAYLAGGKKSQYARKASYCAKHGVYGFQVSEPKPWKQVG
jgi:hypothetical protein